MAGDDKLIRIFKALHFEKQLSLARESEQLRHVFENHIWKVNYRTLKIEAFDEQCFDVTNETHLNRVILTNEETMLHFIEFYAEKVKILISFGFYDIQLFKNLTSLRCYSYSAKWCVSKLIEAVARSLEHLESLELRGFPVNNSLGKTKTVNALLQMKKLKSLYMDIYCYKIKYNIFCQLASKLEILKLPGNLEPDENNENCETENATLTHFDQLRELEIFTTFDPKNWSHKYLEFLSTFKSLTTLTITLTNEIDDCMWTTFVANCQELEKLSISHTNFKNITDFFVPQKLTELKLEYCKGLTYNNLKQILQEETKLTDYVSIYTFYEGEFKDFKITSTMRKLKIECIDMCIFRSAFDRNDNLKILKWYQRHESCTKCMKSLALCTHLERLHVEPLTQVTFEALQKLTHLQKLTTSIDDLTHWSCFIDLLKYSALSNLTVHISVNPKSAPTKGFPINISTLKVNCHLEPDGFVLDFLLDLFCQNPDMKLSFIPFNLETLVKSLVNHENFPTNLKTIVVWGSTLNCDDLRQNFEDTFKDIDSTGNLWEDDDIILCRK